VTKLVVRLQLKKNKQTSGFVDMKNQSS